MLGSGSCLLKAAPLYHRRNYTSSDRSRALRRTASEVLNYYGEVSIPFRR